MLTVLPRTSELSSLETRGRTLLLQNYRSSHLQSHMAPDGVVDLRHGQSWHASRVRLTALDHPAVRGGLLLAAVAQHWPASEVAG